VGRTARHTPPALGRPSPGSRTRAAKCDRHCEGFTDLGQRGQNTAYLRPAPQSRHALWDLFSCGYLRAGDIVKFPGAFVHVSADPIGHVVVGDVLDFPDSRSNGLPQLWNLVLFVLPRYLRPTTRNAGQLTILGSISASLSLAARDFSIPL